jgi:hypothetical protein
MVGVPCHSAEPAFRYASSRYAAIRDPANRKSPSCTQTYANGTHRACRAALSMSHASVQRRGEGASSLHLLVCVSQEMVERFYPDQAEARIFHVGDDVERDGQSSRKQKHMYPALCATRGHAKAGEE